MKAALIAGFIFLFSLFGNAQENRFQFLSCPECLNFSAPQVYIAENIPSPEVGLIVYDTYSNLFRGYNASGTWDPISKPPKAPTVTKFTTGTSQTYTVPSGPAPLYIRVRMVGGGGGGAGSGTVIGNTGGSGGSTIFSTAGGSAILTAGGGSGGVSGTTGGGSGGTVTVISGPIGTALQGGSGSGSAGTITNNVYMPGGTGAASPFGGAGGGGIGTAAGKSAISNSGSGGGGAGGFGSASTVNSGSGGGAGGYIDVVISPPSSSYQYTVGAGGSPGTAGTSGTAGGSGGSGYIEITEYYQ